MYYTNNEVTMPLGDYLALRDKAVEYERLLIALFGECTLGYGGAILFNDQNINGYLKYAVRDRYSRKVEELKLKAEKDEQ